MKRFLSIALAMMVFISICMPMSVHAGSKDIKNYEELSEDQKEALAVMNYMVVLTQKINTASNNRMYLEEIRSSIGDNLYMNALNEKSAQYITDLFNQINGYRMISAKRERLEYVYEQTQAEEFQQILKTPLIILSLDNPTTSLSAMADIAVMAKNVIESYKSVVGEDKQSFDYLNAGWELDSEADSLLADSITKLFSFRFETVSTYGFSDSFSLTEEKLEDFVETCNKTSADSKIQYFEAYQDDYEAFGGYWLELARCYYQVENYQKCVEALDKYQEIQPKIFHRDYDFASILPLGIMAAKETYIDEDYAKKAEAYLVQLEENWDKKDWAKQYFASQVYVDLYGITSDEAYLDKAYKLIKTTVNYLVDVQRKKNDEYVYGVQEATVPKEAEDTSEGKNALDKVITAVIPKGIQKQIKDDVSQFNKLIKKEIKTALPPVYEPLRLCCDLLMDLADKTNVSDSERITVDKILHEGGKPLFLNEPLDDLYWMNPEAKNNPELLGASFDGSKLTVPAKYMTQNAEITVTIVDGKNKSEFGNWEIEKVNRNKNNDADAYNAVYTCDGVDNFKYSKDTTVSVVIKPYDDADCDPISYSFVVDQEKYKNLFVTETIKFKQQN